MGSYSGSVPDALPFYGTTAEEPTEKASGVYHFDDGPYRTGTIVDPHGSSLTTWNAELYLVSYSGSGTIATVDDGVSWGFNMTSWKPAPGGGSEWGDKRSLNPVPEPSGLLRLGLGLAAAGVIGRERW